VITSQKHAIAVQHRRRQAGKKGRAKAVRRWFKRTHGAAIDANSPSHLPAGLADDLRGDFDGCRPFDKVHL